MSVTPTAIARDGWGTSLTATPRLERARHHGHRSQRRVERRHVGHDLAQLRRPSTTYDYADQDPVNEYDPGGECPVCVVALALGVVVVAGAVYGAYESWQHAHSAPRTAPAGDAAVIVRERGVIVEIYSNDHGPPHAHVVGGGPETRIGQNGKPIDDDPELTQRQRQVVEGHRGAIRKRIGRAMRDYRHH
jgi:hypothetical protein